MYLTCDKLYKEILSLKGSVSVLSHSPLLEWKWHEGGFVFIFVEQQWSEGGFVFSECCELPTVIIWATVGGQVSYVNKYIIGQD